MADPSVLVAVDESPGGRHAVRLARAVTSGAGGRLTVMNVLTIRGRGPAPAGRLLSTRVAGPEAEELAHFRSWLGEDARSGPGIPAEVVVAFGIPGIEVTRLADQRAADLIVLGRRPRTREHRLLLGETADAVVRRSDTPVLFVPPETRALGRVLMALDGGDRSLRVLETAADFVQVVGAPSLEAVIVEPDRDDEAAADSPLPLSGRSLRLEAMLSQFARDRPGLPAIPLSVRRGPVIEEVLAEVEAARPDVLVIGYRRGGPPKVVGPRDIARNLLYAAPTAVLTVPL